MLTGRPIEQLLPCEILFAQHPLVRLRCGSQTRHLPLSVDCADHRSWPGCCCCCSVYFKHRLNLSAVVRGRAKNTAKSGDATCTDWTPENAVEAMTESADVIYTSYTAWGDLLVLNGPPGSRKLRFYAGAVKTWHRSIDIDELCLRLGLQQMEVVEYDAKSGR